MATLGFVYASLAVAATAAVYTAVETKKAAADAAKASSLEYQAQRRQAQAQRRIANIKSQRAKTQAFREERKLRGTVFAQQEASGVTSTGIAGFAGSAQTQTAASIGAGEQISGIQTDVSIFNEQTSAQVQSLFQSQAKHQGRAATGKSVGQISSIFSS